MRTDIHCLDGPKSVCSRSTMSESAKPRRTDAVISVKWASEFQQEAEEKALREVLRAWQEFYAERNRGNVIDIGEPPPKG